MKKILLFPITVLFSNFILIAQMPSGKENIPSTNLEFEKEMVDLINIARKKRRLKALEWNEDLARAARYHAKDMYDDSYFEHDSYDRINRRRRKIGKTFDRVRKFLPNNLSPSTENIGAGQESAREMFIDWMNSPGHRENIFDRDSKYIGIGYFYAENDREDLNHYWVMDTGN